MESIVFNFVSKVFELVKFLIAVGLIVSVLSSLQKRAGNSLSTGLVSMKSINEQLVGKTK